MCRFWRVGQTIYPGRSVCCWAGPQGASKGQSAENQWQPDHVLGHGVILDAHQPLQTVVLDFGRIRFWPNAVWPNPAMTANSHIPSSKDFSACYSHGNCWLARVAGGVTRFLPQRWMSLEKGSSASQSCRLKIPCSLLQPANRCTPMHSSGLIQSFETKIDRKSSHCP